MLSLYLDESIQIYFTAQLPIAPQSLQFKLGAPLDAAGSKQEPRVKVTAGWHEANME
jgi:hypothetical protein